MEKIQADKVFIVHVRENNDLRRKFITAQMKAHGIDFEFMLHGDICDLTPENMSPYFVESLVGEKPAPRESCTYKHVQIYEEIVKRNIPSALIFEDDAFLSVNFNEVFNATMREAKSRSDINWDKLFISYENSMLAFVPKSKLKAETYLYRAENTRCAGAYFITLPVAKSILEYTSRNKLDVAIDWQHKKMLDEGLLDVYWCHPAIAEQGSHNGKIPTLLDDKKSGLLRQLSWSVQRFYKEKIRTLFK